MNVEIARLLADGFLYPIGDSDFGVPPLVLLFWYQKLAANAGATIHRSLLGAATVAENSFMEASTPGQGNVANGIPFEKQLAGIVICTADSLRQFGIKETSLADILGLEFLTSTCGRTPQGWNDATFNKRIDISICPRNAMTHTHFSEDTNFEDLRLGSGTRLGTVMGTVILPTMPNNPGFDLLLPAGESMWFFESKLVQENVSLQMVKEKLTRCFQTFNAANNQVTGVRKDVIRLFNSRDFVFVIGGGAPGFTKDAGDFSAIAKHLRKQIVGSGLVATDVNVKKCLVFVDRKGLKGLLPPMLSCLTP